MNLPYALEMHVCNLHGKDLIDWCFEKQFLKNAAICSVCNVSMNFSIYKRNKNGFAWRCMFKNCANYKNYTSIRQNLFFDNFKVDINIILQIIIRYACKTSRYSLKRYFGLLYKDYITKILKLLIEKMPIPDFSNKKLGGPGLVVQVDETMMNYKYKSHRGRSPSNKTDALCIIEYADNITRAFATIIPDKTSATLIPIIFSQVAPNSIIWTDEHRSYSCLPAFNYMHDTLCHKYEFINGISGVNTQAVESFNNIIKYEIKNRKVVKTSDRILFLEEVCWLFNNQKNLIENLFDIIKIQISICF